MASVCVVVPMGPACVDLTGIRAGDKNEFVITLHQNGRPVDLTGLTPEAQAREKVIDETAAITAVCTITDPLNGVMSVRWPGADVRTLLAGAATWKGVWDLQVGNGSGDPTTVAAGSFAAEMDVTR